MRALVWVWACLLLLLVCGVALAKAPQVRRPPERAQLDEFYELLTDPTDSLSVASTARRVVVLMDSICTHYTGMRCAP